MHVFHSWALVWRVRFTTLSVETNTWQMKCFTQQSNYGSWSSLSGENLLDLYVVHAHCLFFSSCNYRKNNALTTRQCIQNIYSTHGLKGFYKGITASYVGVTETVIHFVIYESIKAHLLSDSHSLDGQRSYMDFLRFMFAGACSKTCATCIAYPHGKFCFC